MQQEEEIINRRDIGVRIHLDPTLNPNKNKSITIDVNLFLDFVCVEYTVGDKSESHKYKNLPLFLQTFYDKKDTGLISCKIIELLFYIYNMMVGFRCVAFAKLSDVEDAIKCEFVHIGLCDETYTISSALIFKDKSKWEDI